MMVVMVSSLRKGIGGPHFYNVYFTENIVFQDCGKQPLQGPPMPFRWDETTTGQREVNNLHIAHEK
jgi:hypothetical protein